MDNNQIDIKENYLYRDIGLIDKMPETMTAEKEKPTQTEVV